MQLEKVLRDGGEERMADLVYAASRRHETTASNWPRFVLFWLYGTFAGYGVRRLRLVGTMVLLVALGAWIFQQPRAVAKKQIGHEPAVVKEGLDLQAALGFSVHQFLPIEIASGSQWEPSDNEITLFNRTFLFTYKAFASLQKVLGFVLVPLGVAALAGVLYRRATR
jgi:hypothetical protein